MGERTRNCEMQIGIMTKRSSMSDTRDLFIYVGLFICIIEES